MKRDLCIWNARKYLERSGWFDIASGTPTCQIHVSRHVNTRRSMVIASRKGWRRRCIGVPAESAVVVVVRRLDGVGGGSRGTIKCKACTNGTTCLLVAFRVLLRNFATGYNGPVLTRVAVEQKIRRRGSSGQPLTPSLVGVRCGSVSRDDRITQLNGRYEDISPFAL